MSGFIRMNQYQSVPKPSKPKPTARPLIFAVDFDGTLCKERYPEIGAANQFLIDWLIMQRQKGVKLILWTMREGQSLDAAVRWCREHGLEFDAVNDNLQVMKDRYNNNPRKVFADVYIDDKNM